ncbi:MAG: hypothetical protein V3T22_09560 [Planctomycetota bacterium]
MKYTQRLDDGRLAEVLNERGMASVDILRELLQSAQAGGVALSEALVSSGTIGDWDLSRVVCEIFQLPFLPVDMVKPDVAILEDVDMAFLSEHALVPINRFGRVLTVAMPGMVTADVLAMLSANTDMVVLPVVGTVETNRRWLEEHGASAAPKSSASSGDGWSTMFDEADAAVQLSLDDDVVGADLGLDEADLAGLEEMEFTDDGADDGPPSLVDLDLDLDQNQDQDQDQGTDSSGIELPPMPEFGGAE